MKIFIPENINIGEFLGWQQIVEYAKKKSEQKKVGCRLTKKYEKPDLALGGFGLRPEAIH